MVPGHPAVFNGGTAGAHHAAQKLRQFAHQLEILRASHAASAGYDDFGVLQVHTLAEFLHRFLHHGPQSGKLHALSSDRRSASGLFLRLAKGSGANGHHGLAVYCHGLRQGAAVNRTHPAVGGQRHSVRHTADLYCSGCPGSQFLAVPGSAQQQCGGVIPLE